MKEVNFLSAPSNFLAQWFRNFDSKILGLTIISIKNGRTEWLVLVLLLLLLLLLVVYMTIINITIIIIINNISSSSSSSMWRAQVYPAPRWQASRARRWLVEAFMRASSK